MANLINNVVLVKGRDNHIDEWREFLKDDELKLAKIVPPPEGATGKWRSENWGTVSEIDEEPEPTDIDANMIRYSFQTEWSGPNAAIHRASRMFPKLQFSILWVDPQQYYGKELVYENGDHMLVKTYFEKNELLWIMGRYEMDIEVINQGEDDPDWDGQIDLTSPEEVDYLIDNTESGFYSTFTSNGEKAIVAMMQGHGFDLQVFQDNGWLREDEYLLGQGKVGEMYVGRWGNPVSDRAVREKSTKLEDSLKEVDGKEFLLKDDLDE
jgi:Ferredoxin-like domain in Api92-like protein